MTRVHCPCGTVYDYFGHDVDLEYCPDCIEHEERYQADGAGKGYSLEAPALSGSNKGKGDG